jgi:hypothetical protein
MNTAKPKIYPMKTVWRLYALIFPLMGLAFPALFGWALLNADRPPDTATWAVAIIGSALLFVLCMAIYVGMTRVRLEVSRQGIAYHSLGYKVAATWDNIAAIGEVQVGRYTYEGLLLRESGLQVSEWLRAGTAAYPVMSIIAALSGRPIPPMQTLESYGRGIPLGLFVTDWRRSALGDDIRRYAPEIAAWTAPQNSAAGPS